MRRITALLGVVAMVAAAAVPAAATGNVDRSEPRQTSRRAIDLDRTDLLAARDTIKVFVQLSTPSVADYVASELEAGRPEPSEAAQKAQARKVEREHDELEDDVEQAGGEIVAEMTVGANGFTVEVSPQDLPKLAAIPGVVSVARVTTFTPANETSVPWIGAPEVWDTMGLTGEGVTIAVIDTGIDYTHATFGGSGNPDDYANNDPTIIEPGTFPTAKVIGGWDFAGTYYDASGRLGPDVPSPDPDPLDGNGHGTHVAGTAAGMGVLADGSTYMGPYDPSAYENHAFEVGPGVAPEALIYAFKVFGDVAGSTDLTSLAIERALDPNQDGSIDDRVDVINMSLGAAFGSPHDPSAIASQNAVRLGVVVVASAGNSGDVPYVTGAPAVAPGAISVAASVDGGYSVSGIEVTVDGTPSLVEAAEGGLGPSLRDVGPISGPVAVAVDDGSSGDPTFLCGPSTVDLTGKIALVQRGACTFSTKYLNAQDAGAIAIIVYNDAARGDALVNMGGDSTGISIPGVFIGNSDGTAIASAIAGSSTVSATLSADIEIPKPELADTMAGFSSRGPGVTNLFKPDVAAPGLGIQSAAVGTGTQGVKFGGTSMAAPHVAGLAALVRQARPDLSPEGVKALIQNGTVVGASTDGTPYPLARQGVGVVRADRTLRLDAYASPGGVSFGYINRTEKGKVKRTVEITNLSPHTQTFDVTVTPNQTVPGVTIEAPDRVKVKPGKTKKVRLEVRVDPAAMPWDFGGNSQLEFDGWVTFTSDTETLQVGYLAVVDPAAEMEVDFDDGALEFENDSDTVAFADGFTLAARGGLLLDKTPFAIDATGYRTNNLFGYDVVQFGVSSDKAWNSLSESEIDIWLDTDEDGVFDYVLVAVDLGFLLGSGPTGDVATALFDLSTGRGTLQWFADSDLNDRVATLTVDRTGATGFLDPGDTTFDYMMVMFGRAGSVDLQFGSVDLADEVVPDVASFGLLPGDEATVGVTGPDGSRMVWFFMNNEEKKQVDVVKVEREDGHDDHRHDRDGDDDRD